MEKLWPFKVLKLILKNVTNEICHVIIVILVQQLDGRISKKKHLYKSCLKFNNIIMFLE